MTEHTIITARNVISEYVVSGWTAAVGAGVELFLDNEKGAEPAASVKWGRLTIRNISGAQNTLGPIGARKYERRAQATIQCFGPLHAGLEGIDTVAKGAANLLEGSGNPALVGLKFLAATIREIGPNRGWFQINVDVPFDYFETR